MKFIYYSLIVKIKQNNTVLIAISTIKLWLIYKLGFYYPLQFIPTLSGSSWWATNNCSEFFLVIFPRKCNCILKYGKAIYK